MSAASRQRVPAVSLSRDCAATLRAAVPLDAGAMGAILHGFERETPWMPDMHSQAEAIGFCDRMIARGWVRVAISEGRLAGFLARDASEICALYVAPTWRGRGVGRALLADAMTQSAILHLRTHLANDAALRFYLRAGFVEGGRTDGRDNDEGLPDIELHWQAGAHDPLNLPEPAPSPARSLVKAKRQQEP